MGIANLNKFLRKNCPGVFRQISIKELSSLKAAVDISLYIFKYKTVFGDSWINALLYFVMYMRQHNIHTCFIYDTAAPKEKDEERQRRKEHRAKLEDKLATLVDALEKAKTTGEIEPVLVEFNKSLPAKKSLLLTPSNQIDLKVVEYELTKRLNQTASVCEDDFKMSKELLDILCIPWFQAEMEAETTCADLCIRNRVEVVFSDDTDVLCYGAPHVVTKINTGDGSAVLVSHAEVLESLDLSHEQFVDFCIMCGTDYNKNIPNIGPEKAFKLIKQYGNIDAMIPDIDVSILNHIRVRELFLNYKKTENTAPFCREPNFADVELFLVKNNIKVNFEKVKKSFGAKEIILDE